MERSTVEKQVSTCRRQHLLSIFLIVSIFFHNLGSTRAKVVLPVTRSFSKLSGSGVHEGEAEGMTREHAQALKDHDFQRSQRHRRSLTAADFLVDANEYHVGLYYTELALGTPSESYFVQVDTGSDLLWVNCEPCEECFRNTNTDLPLNIYDPQASSTGKNYSCSSAYCSTLANISATSCIDNSCYYSINYGGEKTAAGYLVEDVLTFDTIVDNDTFGTASTDIAFGCGFNKTWISLLEGDRQVDGILGFGRQALSVVSQLADSDLTANEFAHCLEGDGGDGGQFVVGDVEEPGLVYTLMVPDGFDYKVNLQNISVGGTILNIDSGVFSSNRHNDKGTIFDNGMTMALLVDEAFDAFFTQLLSGVTVPPLSSQGTRCFRHTSSDLSVFPNVTLYFEGGAEMSLKPENYLYKMQVSTEGFEWCLAWSPSRSSDVTQTIFGDIVLKNKLVVYDIENGRIGWKDFDCESDVKISSPSAGNGSNSPGNQDTPDTVNRGSGSSYPPAVPVRVLILLFALASLSSLF